MVRKYSGLESRGVLPRRKAQSLEPRACYFALAAIFLIIASTSFRSLSLRFVE